MCMISPRAKLKHLNIVRTLLCACTVAIKKIMLDVQKNFRTKFWSVRTACTAHGCCSWVVWPGYSKRWLHVKIKGENKNRETSLLKICSFKFLGRCLIDTCSKSLSMGLHECRHGEQGPPLT